MGKNRLLGIVDWYRSEKGYGIILGMSDNQEYFIHHSNHPDIVQMEADMLVTFLPRPRKNNTRGMEAYDVQKAPEKKENDTNEKVSDTPESQPIKKTFNTYKLADIRPASKRKKMKNAGTPTSEQMKNTKPQNSQESQKAAVEEALRRQRARKLGHLEQSGDQFPVGSRVYNKYHGEGTVLLAAPNVVSVRFDKNPHEVVEILPGILSKAAPKSTPEVPKAKKVHPRPKPQTVKPKKIFNRKVYTTIGGYIQQLASDVKEKLIEEKIEVDGVYKFIKPSAPSTPVQKMSIDSRVASAFKKASNIEEFYSHQIEARQALLRGKHVMISTPTASGKTEAYNPTILETLLNEPRATALYIFPLVALGLDQTERLEMLNRYLPETEQLEIGIYNSNIEKESKQQTLKANNRILVTTPDSLHYIFLPKPYPNWRNFYRNLRYIVLDEAHIYKGVFGANMANIVRRLLVRSRREGNTNYPQITISSATVRHPKQLAHQLTGLPNEDFEVIDQSGAPTPGRHFLATRSDIHDTTTLCSELLNVTTIDARTNEKRPVSIIVFLRSINAVKQETKKLRNRLREEGHADQVRLVDAFYGDKGNKADTLTKLRQGKIRCIFSTTALMAGIDVGALDVAIVKNFPGLIMDARQMFGRAGRRGEGAVIFIANRKDPFDQFYFERPKELFEGPTEDVVANPENPTLLAAHLLCAAQTIAKYNQEGPLPGTWSNLFGQTGKDLLDFFVQNQSLLVKQGNYHLTQLNDPHDEEPLKDLRSIQGETYLLKDEATGEKLEEKREQTAYRDAHREAIVWVNGQNYRVIDFDKRTREIRCARESNNDLRTRGLQEQNIQILAIDPETWANIKSGKINITTSINKYMLYKTHPVMQCRNLRCLHETPDMNTQRCAQCGSAVRSKLVEEVVDTYEIPTPPDLLIELETRASWLKFSPSVKRKFAQEFWPRWQENTAENKVVILPNYDAALHSAAHAIVKAMPEYIRCDRDEIGATYILDKNKDTAEIYIYDNFSGGLGYADQFSYDPKTLLEGALDIIERCTCIDDKGCPVCLSYFNCGHFNTSLSKLAGRYLLRIMLGEDTQKVIDDLKEYTHVVIPSNQIVTSDESQESKQATH